jgi:putative ABC transport system substrate-binding protein
MSYTAGIDRRTFLSTMGLTVLGAPLAANAQQTKTYRVGLLWQSSPPPPGSKPGPFLRTLNDLGYIEGRNLVLEYRWAEGDNERFPSLAAELVAQKPDIVVADSTPGAIAAKRATATIPIVMVNVSDPVGTGLVASLAHPGAT